MSEPKELWLYDDGSWDDKWHDDGKVSPLTRWYAYTPEQRDALLSCIKRNEDDNRSLTVERDAGIRAYDGLKKARDAAMNAALRMANAYEAVMAMSYGLDPDGAEIMREAELAFAEVHNLNDTASPRPPLASPVEGEAVGKWDGHASDCATHNAPAMPNGPCDCGLASFRCDRREELARLVHKAWATTWQPETEDYEVADAVLAMYGYLPKATASPSPSRLAAAEGLLKESRWVFARLPSRDDEIGRRMNEVSGNIDTFIKENAS